MGAGIVEKSPPFRRRLIRRPRLTDLLTQSEDRPILLVAPAGYGKTTLAREWLELQGAKHAWYQATAASSDPAALAWGLADAIREVLPTAGSELRTRLKTLVDPAAEAASLAEALARDMSGWPSKARLVIDDYHAIESTAAEELIETLVRRTNVPFLVTSRRRPSWIGARKLLYGEVIEFGRHVLAMTPGEAAEILEAEKGKPLPGLVALADGWPAVIGLAALLSEPTPPERSELPETLHAYFAEELYTGLGEDVRRDLVQIALAPSFDERLADVLFSTRTREVIEESYGAGFLSRVGDSYEIHPLLRQFLRSKADELDAEEVRSKAALIGSWYANESLWDEAMDLAEEFELAPLLTRVLEDALDDVLAQGRLTTLNRWLELARRLAPTEPIVHLATIEVAFRTGDWATAAAKAEQLVGWLPEEHPIASRAFFRAGQIAHIDDRLEEALALLTIARDKASTPGDLRRCLWSSFVTLTDLEDLEGATKALDEFQGLPPLEVDDLIRSVQGRLQLAIRWGGITDALENASGILDLLTHTSDPLVRTGFLQTYATALHLATRYDVALDVSQQQIAEAQRSGLKWVLPHALEIEAAARIGLRDFDGALRVLARARRMALDHGNIHTQVNSLVLTARVHLAQGAPERAADLLKEKRGRSSSPGMEGDYFSTKGFALACCSRNEEAESALVASEVTDHVDARVLRSFARAIMKHLVDRESREARELLGLALEEAQSTGNYDAFVCAYRATPSVLLSLRDFRETKSRPFWSVVEAVDSRLAATVGGEPSKAERALSRGTLTPREHEVLHLLRQGLSNRQIARTLWIAESTVKVHVHHVLEKLGARSRTEAAARSQDDL